MQTLVTKLKGSVNNNNLPRLGTITIKAIYVEGTLDANKQQMLKIKTSTPVDISVDNGGSFATTAAGLSTNPQTTFTTTGNGTYTDTLYFSNGNYNVYINDKYSIKSLILGEGSFSSPTDVQHVLQLNASMLSYTTSLEDFRFYSHSLNGNIDYLANSQQIKAFQLLYSDIKGDFTIFDNNNAITQINIFGCNNITADISSLLKSSITSTTVYISNCAQISGDITSCAAAIPNVTSFKFANTPNISGNFKDLCESMWNDRASKTGTFNFQIPGTSCEYFGTKNLTAQVSIIITSSSITCKYGTTQNKITTDGTTWNDA